MALEKSLVLWCEVVVVVNGIPFVLMGLFLFLLYCLKAHKYREPTKRQIIIKEQSFEGLYVHAIDRIVQSRRKSFLFGIILLALT
jgi:hypothetical protein